jgi:hypothetical protein
MRSPLWIALFLIALFASLTFSAGRLNAEDRYTVCLGEFDRNCPVKHDVFIYCGTQIESEAKSICTVHDGDKDRVSPYQIVHQGSTGGNKCGYEWFLVTCLNPSGN